MPFGYPDKIFKYPAVQYIPLQLYKIINGNYPYPGKKPRFNIYTPENNNELNLQLNKINSDIRNYNIAQQQLAILVLNGIIDIIKYRAYEVFMVGSIDPGNYYLFKITNEYFYKDGLIFTFYNGEDGKKIDQERFVLERLN
ncbi:MAG: hypothetical protein K9K76_11070 [Halanaerobiales bacterium]|nr:hypothetical protein [Halanaerobiales bacterium]